MARMTKLDPIAEELAAVALLAQGRRWRLAAGRQDVPDPYTRREERQGVAEPKQPTLGDMLADLVASEPPRADAPPSPTEPGEANE